MFEEAQLYSPVTDGRRRHRHRPPRRRPPRQDRSRLPAAAQRDRRGGARLGAAASPCRGSSTTRPSRRSGARSRRELAPKHARYACRAFLRRAPALCAADRPDPAARRGHRRARAADRLSLRARGRDRPGEGVLRQPRRPRVPLDPVRPPPVGAALHPRARPDPRGDRARQPARRPASSPSSTGSPARRRGAPRPTEGVQYVADVFWFTIEFGVLIERGELRAYGAGILSSYGEIEEFREMEIRPLDFHQMGTIDYDITHYQPVLFAAESKDAPGRRARSLLRRLRRRDARTAGVDSGSPLT